MLAMLDTASKSAPYPTSAANLARQNGKLERMFVDCTVADAGGRHHCEATYESLEMTPRFRGGHLRRLLPLHAILEPTIHATAHGLLR